MTRSTAKHKRVPTVSQIIEAVGEAGDLAVTCQRLGDAFPANAETLERYGVCPGDVVEDLRQAYNLAEKAENILARAADKHAKYMQPDHRGPAPGVMPCPACMGLKKVYRWAKPVPCPECDATGEIPADRYGAHWQEDESR